MIKATSCHIEINLYNNVIDACTAYLGGKMTIYIKKNTYLLVILLTLFLPCCKKKKLTTNTTIETYTHIKNKLQKESHIITIWIHGTVLPTQFLFRNFFFRKLGIRHIDTYKKKSNSLQIAKTLCKQNTCRFNRELFYMYGWSGKLSHSSRMDAARNLYNEIVTLIQNYKEKTSITPKIRIITHSHGGNVALCLAEIMRHQKEKFTIAELVLLACPVQRITEHLIRDQCFKKVYSLYSSLDILQVIDPQGIQYKKDKNTKQLFFSQRTFASQKNLMQTRIKINSRSILHVEFITQKFARLIPYILEELDSWEKDDQSAYKKNKLLIVTTKHGQISFIKKIMRPILV